MDDGDRVDGRYGGAFTFFTGGMSAKEPTSSKTSSEYYLLTGYTDWRGKGLFIDTQVTIGYGNLKGRRYLTLTDSTNDTTLSREAESQRASELLAGSITMGGIFTAGSTVFMPQVDVDGMTMREEGYTEIERRPGLRSARPALLRKLAARLHRRGPPPGLQFRRFLSAARAARRLSLRLPRRRAEAQGEFRQRELAERPDPGSLHARRTRSRTWQHRAGWRRRDDDRRVVDRSELRLRESVERSVGADGHPDAGGTYLSGVSDA